MIARFLLIAIVIASAVGLVVLSVLDGLVPGYGLAIIAVVLIVGFHVMTAAAVPRPTRREADEWLRRVRQPGEGREVWRARMHDEAARDDAHSRLGL